MDRSIFNLTKYSIFHYLHCTDTQINTHYSSALRPPLCHRRGKNTAGTDRHDDVLSPRRRALSHTRTHTHTYTHTSAPISEIEMQWRGRADDLQKT